MKNVQGFYAISEKEMRETSGGSVLGALVDLVKEVVKELTKPRYPVPMV